MVRAADGDRTRLHAALVDLADQDPLIRTRAFPCGESSVLLYGEVQKEVIAATLAEEYGVEALFGPSRTVYIERPIGAGEYSEEVTDAVVTMVRSGFCSVTSTAGDFRKLAPFVLMRALTEAGTELYEPCHAFELDVPADTVSAVLSALIAAEAEIEASEGGSAWWSLRGNLPARTVRDVKKRLPALTRGEAVWLSQAAGDRKCCPVSGSVRTPEPPTAVLSA